MNQDQLRGDTDALRAAIEHELQLAQDGDGYEPGPVAEEIVRFYAAPLLTEIARLRREVEFEANAEQFNHGWTDLSLRPCACLPGGTTLPADWSGPQCSVHPDGGETDG